MSAVPAEIPAPSSPVPAGPRRPPRRLHLRPALEALGILAALALGTWGLSRLGDIHPPRVAARELRDDQGGCIWILPRRRGAGGPAGIHCREPAGFDAGRFRLSFPDGTERIVPPRAGTVLVRPGRRLEVLPAPPPAFYYTLLLAHGRRRPASHEAWFRTPEGREALAGSPEPLVTYWTEPSP